MIALSFSQQDCYLIGTGVEDVGLFILMGKNTRDKWDLRMEAVTRAETDLRTQPEYNNFTTAVGQ